MKMTTGKESRHLTCAVSAAGFKLRTPKPQGLESDTIGYAVCRFLTKSPSLCRDYVEDSYRLRMGKGKRRIKHWFCAPAALMELPGGWVQAQVSIDAIGVTVTGVGFYDSLDMLERKESRVHIGVYTDKDK